MWGKPAIIHSENRNSSAALTETKGRLTWRIKCSNNYLGEKKENFVNFLWRGYPLKVITTLKSRKSIILKNFNSLNIFHSCVSERNENGEPRKQGDTIILIMISVFNTLNCLAVISFCISACGWLCKTNIFFGDSF